MASVDASRTRAELIADSQVAIREFSRYETIRICASLAAGLVLICMPLFFVLSLSSELISRELFGQILIGFLVFEAAMVWLVYGMKRLRNRARSRYEALSAVLNTRPLAE